MQITPILEILIGVVVVRVEGIVVEAEETVAEAEVGDEVTTEEDGQIEGVRTAFVELVIRIPIQIQVHNRLRYLKVKASMRLQIPISRRGPLIRVTAPNLIPRISTYQFSRLFIQRIHPLSPTRTLITPINTLLSTLNPTTSLTLNSTSNHITITKTHTSKVCLARATTPTRPSLPGRNTQ